MHMHPVDDNAHQLPFRLLVTLARRADIHRCLRPRNRRLTLLTAWKEGSTLGLLQHGRSRLLTFATRPLNNFCLVTAALPASPRICFPTHFRDPCCLITVALWPTVRLVAWLVCLAYRGPAHGPHTTSRVSFGAPAGTLGGARESRAKPAIAKRWKDWKVPLALTRPDDRNGPQDSNTSTEQGNATEPAGLSPTCSHHDRACTTAEQCEGLEHSIAFIILANSLHTV